MLDPFLDVASNETSSSWVARNILNFRISFIFSIQEFTDVASNQCVNMLVSSTQVITP